MLLYPSLDELLKRVDSKYSLVMLAAKRAHQLNDPDNTKNPPMLDEYQSVRNVGKALEEIQSGDLIIDSKSIQKD